MFIIQLRQFIAMYALMILFVQSAGVLGMSESETEFEGYIWLSTASISTQSWDRVTIEDTITGCGRVSFSAGLGDDRDSVEYFDVTLNGVTTSVSRAVLDRIPPAPLLNSLEFSCRVDRESGGGVLQLHFYASPFHTIHGFSLDVSDWKRWTIEINNQGFGDLHVGTGDKLPRLWLGTVGDQVMPSWQSLEFETTLEDCSDIKVSAHVSEDRKRLTDLKVISNGVANIVPSEFLDHVFPRPLLNSMQATCQGMIGRDFRIIRPIIDFLSLPDTEGLDVPLLEADWPYMVLDFRENQLWYMFYSSGGYCDETYTGPHKCIVDTVYLKGETP